MDSEDTSQNIQRITALKQILAAHDDRGRKLAFETAKEIKARFPEAEMPYLTKYLEAEEEAETWREEIRWLEQAENGGEWDGFPYVKGYAPEKPVEAKQTGVRAVRNQYLEQTDKYMISDFPVSKDEKAKYKAYRQYLRDYTEQEGWWTGKPLTFEKWKDEQ